MNDEAKRRTAVSSDFTPLEARMLNNKLQTLHEDVVEMKTSLNKLADAITKLALVEERQSEAAKAQERAFKALEKLEARVAALETKMPDADRAGRWMDRGLWAALAAVFMYVAKKTGLL